MILAVGEDVGTSEVSEGRPASPGPPHLLPLDVPGGEDAVAAVAVKLCREEDRGGRIPPDLTAGPSILRTGRSPAQPRSAGWTEGI